VDNPHGADHAADQRSSGGNPVPERCVDLDLAELETARRGAFATKGKGVGIFAPENRGKGWRAQKGNGTGTFAPEHRGKGGRISGKITDRIVGRENKELKRGWFAPEHYGKGGRIGGPIGGRTAARKNMENKTAIFAPGIAAKAGCIGRPQAVEMEVGIHDPEWADIACTFAGTLTGEKLTRNVIGVAKGTLNKTGP
jgi:hypothetical protein